MGATRKLQGEIDKVLKKVQEGVDVFDSIWNKVYDTENANQKEKFEADLKKEIKKLQRYRDQIKTWLTSSEIKDKKALLDARKQIEREMERFKICEKETKTKAFSKEGLGQQPKTDPREKAKGESRDWLNNMVSELESQIESFEAELEGLTVKRGKTRPPRMTHLDDSIVRHKAHIVKLEQILRLLDNDGVSPDQVTDVKDLVEDYVERNQDDFDDFSEVDEVYSSIPLEKIEALENMEAIANATSVLMVKDKGSKDVFPVPQALDDSSLQQSGVESGAKTPPLQTQQDVSVGGLVGGSGVNSAVSVINGASGLGVGSPITLASVRVTKSNNPSVPSSPVSFSSTVNEEEGGSYLGRSVSLSRGAGRGALPITVNSGQSSPLVSVGMAINATVGTPTSGHGIGSSIPDLSKRTALAGEERLSTGGLTQQLNSPSSSQNRVFLQPSSKLADAVADTGSSTEGGIIGSRLFTSPGGQWRSPAALSFQSPEPGQFMARTEIAPDQKQKFLQRLQQVSQQQQHNNSLLASAQQISHITATSQKQQLQLLQNQPVSLLQASHNAALQQQQQQQQQQTGLTLGVQGQVISTPTTQPQTGLQQGLQAQQLTAAQTAQQIVLPFGASGKENGVRECNGESRLAIIGHRGCGKNIVTVPGVIGDARPSIMENTIVSFNLAARNGADFVEFDVQVTKDGHPIIFHDDFIVIDDKENNCLLHKRIADLTLEEFLAIGYQKDSQKAEKVLLRKAADGAFYVWTVSVDDSLCTLKEAFKQVSPLVGFNIELKFDDYNIVSNQELKRTIDAVLKVVNESAMGRRVYFSSFHPDAVLSLRQEQSLYPILFLTDGAPGSYPDFRRNSLAAAIEVCQSGDLQGIVAEVKAILQHPEAVQQIKETGLTLLTYGDLNNVAEVFHLQESLGVDGVIVDRVSEMVIESWKNKRPIEVQS